MPLASFDVYDTVVTRAVGSPPSVFLLLGRYLARQGCHLLSAEAFARARMTRKSAPTRLMELRAPRCNIFMMSWLTRSVYRAMRVRR